MGGCRYAHPVLVHSAYHYDAVPQLLAHTLTTTRNPPKVKGETEILTLPVWGGRRAALDRAARLSLALSFFPAAYLLDLAEGVLKHVNLGLVADALHYHLRCSVRMSGNSLVMRMRHKDRKPNKHVEILVAAPKR